MLKWAPLFFPDGGGEVPVGTVVLRVNMRSWSKRLWGPPSSQRTEILPGPCRKAGCPTPGCDEHPTQDWPRWSEGCVRGPGVRRFLPPSELTALVSGSPFLTFNWLMS